MRKEDIKKAKDDTFAVPKINKFDRAQRTAMQLKVSSRE